MTTVTVTRFMTALLAVLLVPVVVAAQQPPPVSVETLRADLFTIAADSMGGRDTGSRGDYLATEYVAARFRRLGLEPAGENGSFFQTIPFVHVHVDPAVRLTVDGTPLEVATEALLVAGIDRWDATGRRAVYGGVAGDPSTWPSAAALEGALMVVFPPEGVDPNALPATLQATMANDRTAGAAGFVLVALDLFPADIREQFLQGSVTTDNSPDPRQRPVILASEGAARRLLGADRASLSPGQRGPALGGAVATRVDSLDYPVRNVVAVVRGTDPQLRETYVSMSAHHDHIGLTSVAVDHDSVYAYNHVLRPLGADSPARAPTAAESTRIRELRDSLAGERPDVRDSVFNGADDDGTGTVALLEAARVLSEAPPRRSVLIVSHAAEERGLLGSEWFTDHPTVPLDSIVAEVDMDMIGRGNATDLPDGSPTYLEVIGARRLSTELGDVFERVNTRQTRPFVPDYSFSDPNHPLHYYCRADHYSYARMGIPAMAMSRGEHPDYHQITDEADLIHFQDLARVATLAVDLVAELGNMDHRPVVDVTVDPNAPCR